METNCSKHCLPQNSQNGHYNCSKTGDKIYFDNWYGRNCTSYCKKPTDGRYSCNNTNGLKMCHPYWPGRNCETHCREYVNGTYICNTTTGLKICNQNWYGYNCTVYCKKTNQNLRTLHLLHDKWFESLPPKLVWSELYMRFIAENQTVPLGTTFVTRLVVRRFVILIGIEVNVQPFVKGKMDPLDIIFVTRVQV